MAFLRSLFAGVSGLRNHQTMMDVIGNNIANVNTVAFKYGRASFSELYAQTLRGAGRPLDNTGGTNPMQVGLGMSVNTLDTIFSQGSIETTTNQTDLAIQGNGFFIVNKGGKQLFTRAGRFDLDQNGRLVNPGSGAILQGKMADAAGVVPSGTSLQDIYINKDIKSPAKATTEVKFAGNLDASATVYNAGPPPTGGIINSSVTLFDSLGNQIAMTLQFTKTGPNAWNWSASIPDPAPATTSTNVGSGAVTFNDDGTLQTMSGSPISITPTSGAAVMTVDLNFGTPSATAPGTFSGLTHSATSSSVTAREQDGYSAGLLSNISIDSGGKILGTFTNGTVQTLAQIMLAEFNNPGGLMRSGDNAYDLSGNSGTAAIMTPGETSSVVAGALEQSNVDLADEFTKMITAQRGFQASARVITTSDEFLQEVVNLKR
jgi:flagellar hook protein FlgE